MNDIDGILAAAKTLASLLSEDGGVAFPTRDDCSLAQAAIVAWNRRSSPSAVEAAEVVASGRHEWVRSTLGHGTKMCRHCKGTFEEISIIGDVNRCDASPPPASPSAPQGVEVTLAECPVGLFIHKSGGLCLKTEYGNNEGRIDAYIVSSGEFFWGDAPQTIASHRAQLVTPVDGDALLASLPQPEGETAELVERLRAACVGHPHAKIAWPHRVLHEAADALASLSQRLAVAEARLAVVEAERDEARERHSAHVDYSIDLSRIIESLCRDRDPPEPKTTARYHFDMAIAHRRAAEAQLAHAREAAIEECAKVAAARIYDELKPRFPDLGLDHAHIHVANTVAAAIRAMRFVALLSTGGE